MKAIPTLRSLSVTDGSVITDAGLELIAGIPQLESLIMDKLPISEERLPVFSTFAHLKTLSLALRPQGYPDEIQARVKALLPEVEVKFVK